MDNGFFAARLKKLDADLIEAALELTRHRGAQTLLVPVPGTYPQVYVAVGTPEQIEVAFDIAPTGGSA
ncbi:hypothetical protein KY495_10855 [Massilia sp. PAMC28688]|uniref:hypothetical protein n=1 Tax=Massilia sp. PAMC28688 TaxID=2861283 RepID=UPI001C634657|nr:hypothetical protein [Massilia sp. PAMC28688]QYF95598.1 hypothetical protein KY495_10855 [Massilia sp. PAMC28688]